MPKWRPAPPAGQGNSTGHIKATSVAPRARAIQQCLRVAQGCQAVEFPGTQWAAHLRAERKAWRTLEHAHVQPGTCREVAQDGRCAAGGQWAGELQALQLSPTQSGLSLIAHMKRPLTVGGLPPSWERRRCRRRKVEGRAMASAARIDRAPSPTETFTALQDWGFECWPLRTGSDSGRGSRADDGSGSGSDREALPGSPGPPQNWAHSGCSVSSVAT